ncbi:MAG TPA: OB-fold domain-containing protein [Acidimicrobiia bacterium]|nr:OB-fold domain-containing protein [Acidimicrobiia bacterium]
MAQRGILAYGVYLPYQRLDRRSISATIGAGGGKGTRTVASYDEDTTSLGVEAARRALKALPAGAPRPTALYFATTDPAYMEKSNAATIHAALGLDPSVVAYDLGGAVRSGIGALRAGLERAEPTLVVLSDVRTGLPGGTDESSNGDAAVAFVTAGTGLPGGEGVTPQMIVAELVAAAGATEELLDKWRLPSEPTARAWEERFAEAILVEPAQAALTDALKQAGITVDGLAAAAVSGTSPRAARKVAAALAGAGATVVDDLSGTVGFTGAAHAGLLLASALDMVAESGEAGAVIASLSLADGADALIFRATDALAAARPTPSLAAQIAGGGSPLPYPTFLTWRGHLRREPPRRPDPARPTSPAAHRGDTWKFGFSASRCLNCSRRHLPPQRVCLECHAVDQMEVERLADVPGTIATHTLDRLAFSLNPPVVVVVVDFDGGGRFQCELTDVDPSTVAIGQRVEMTFRRLFTAEGVHNYFWKAKPIAPEVQN